MNNSGTPLMPSVARPIILRLFAQQAVWKRGDLANKVEELHLAEGGMKGSEDVGGVITRALRELLHDGLVAKTAPGYWAAVNTGQQGNARETQGNIVPEEEEGVDPDEMEFLGQNDHTLIEKQVGIGPESVYLYFNPAERELAQLKKMETWPCKIGLCRGDPTIRVLTQGVKTAFSSAPVIGLVMKTTEAAYLEKSLHASLRLTESATAESLGTEWFDTSPSRILKWWGFYVDGLNALNGLPNNIAQEVHETALRDSAGK